MFQPSLVASTGDTFNKTPIIDPVSQARSLDTDSTETFSSSKQDESNFFSQAQWTADGTTIITNSADQQIRTFVIPPDLLDERDSPLKLDPYSTIPSREPVYATALYPGFQLQDPATTLILSSMKDHPIRLNSALSPDLLASYPLVNQNTEAFICPHSLLFTSNGTRFLAGSDSLISVFDISRPGSEPITQLPTIPSKRRKNLGGGVGMKGIVSALAEEPSTAILAAGTFTGQIGLYTSAGEGDTIGVFSLAGTDARRSIGGSGVSQLKWSPCGKYLYVVERMSNGVLIYDIRDTGQLLGSLTGRKAITNQRMNIDIFMTGQDGGHDIWAGGTDGQIRVWSDPYKGEGPQPPSWDWRAHDDAVTSSVVHPTGTVVASCSGQRHFDVSLKSSQTTNDPDSEDGTTGQVVDNSLKIWSLTDNH